MRSGVAGKPGPGGRVVHALKIGLEAPRAELYDWIAHRVDRMLASGWRAEVSTLIDAGVNPGSQALKGIGVAEMATHIAGGYGLEETRQLVVRRTRNYAKRQLTWFRADSEVRWFDVTAQSLSDIVGTMLETLSAP